MSIIFNLGLEMKVLECFPIVGRHVLISCNYKNSEQLGILDNFIAGNYRFRRISWF